MPRPRILVPCVIFILLLTGKLCFGQVGNAFSIRWNSPKEILDEDGMPIRSLSFEKAVYRSQASYLPSAVIIIPGYVSKITIRDEQTEFLNEEELKVLQKLNPSSIPEPEIHILWQNGKPISHVYFVPLTGLQSSPSKITSFNYTYQTSPYTVTKAAPKISAGSNKAFKLSAFSGASVLSSGSWYKIRVSKSGIFKIDYSFLSSIGIAPTSIDPREIKIYGNGGGMLPQANSAARYDDLTENAIYVAGESDGIFDNSDYALFYAQGPDTWSYNSSKSRFQHTKNLYSDYTYYFLTIGPGNGLRIQDQGDAGTTSNIITTFDERMFHEQDLHNMVESGREWFGEPFDYTTSYTFPFSVPGITANKTLKLFSYVMARSLASSSFSVSVNGNTLGTQSLGAITTYEFSIQGRIDSTEFTLSTNSISGSSVNVTLNYNKGSYSEAVGYLNYLILNVVRDLKLYGTQTAFRSVESTAQALSEFHVDNASSGMFIWDITDPLNPKNQLYTLAGTQASFTANTSTLKEFIAFSGSSFEAPVFTGVVANQNLHGINSPDLPDLVIVTHPNFLNSANRLAQFRRTNDNLEVEVVTTDQVYNEFSSGAQDVSAIRDFMKMLYDRKSGSDSLRYLLLFGDCSYDYKSRLSGNTNYVPVYESRQSLHPIDSYSSDDYFAFLDNSEGVWTEDNSDDHLMDIGVGRFPVKNASEADAVVNKMINYSSSISTLGKWRNKISLVADDGESNLFERDADSLSSKVQTNYPLYNINKIYLDAYPQTSTPGGENCPEVNDAITQAVEKGTFILNYTGHGGEAGWSQEAILTVNQINSWSNFNKLPLVITATCEFGRYDDPGLVSGAETVVLHGSGGGAAIITSTRPVFSNSNKLLNEAIYDCLFIPINGKMPRLGDVGRITKNTSLYGINNRNYALLGDPSLRLAYPVDEMIITKVNGNPASTTDTIKALGTVSLEGEVRSGGIKISGYNGTAYVTVYDKASIINTFGTQGSVQTSFSLMNNFIYEGVATITNGSFSISFVVPKDISYQFDNGKVSLYGMKDASLLDAAGYDSDIIIGGTDTNYAADNDPPVIKLFMNDESFVFGGLTSANSTLLAQLTDDNGINIAGQGIGHEITAVLDNSGDPIVLNEYYSAKKDTYKEGTVQFPFKDLSPGLHSIKFKCWDTHNNSSESYLEFIVANEAKIALDHVLNYPNPFSTHTTFHFDHNRSGDDIDVLIQIYTISGKLIKTLENTQYYSKSHFSDLSWDGRDDFGDKIGKGVYVYKVNIRSLRDGSKVFKYQKLVILN